MGGSWTTHSRSSYQAAKRILVSGDCKLREARQRFPPTAHCSSSSLALVCCCMRIGRWRMLIRDVVDEGEAGVCALDPDAVGLVLASCSAPSLMVDRQNERTCSSTTCARRHSAQPLSAQTFHCQASASCDSWILASPFISSQTAHCPLFYPRSKNDQDMSRFALSACFQLRCTKCHICSW